MFASAAFGCAKATNKALLRRRLVLSSASTRSTLGRKIIVNCSIIGTLVPLSDLF